MARSMTGYGFGEYDLYNRKVSVEIKSVNSKYFDLSIKLPKIISVYENDIKSIIGEEVSRGKVDVFINLVSSSSDEVEIRLNEGLLEKYFEVFDKISDGYGVSMPTMADVLKLDGVVIIEEKSTDVDILAEIWETLFVALNNAISSFVKTREDEGELLKIDILQKINDINVHIDGITKLCPIINAEYKERLQKRIFQNVEGIGINVNDAEINSRILTEVGIFSEKSDIDEELVRFSVNLVNLKNTLINENIIGKKLDFILQELNREVNTMGSKSSDVRLTQHCIALKVIIEKIREQSKNIE